ncbi:MAG: ROK family protein [Acidobacteria bacterium]|nr:MAG: ROK family protein [Acidobacteriota bacterium]
MGSAANRVMGVFDRIGSRGCDASKDTTQIMAQKPHAVWAVDIGGTKIAAARVSRKGGLSDYAEIPTPSAGGRKVVEAVVELLERMPARQIRAIGVDVPGLAWPDGHVWAPNIPGWKRMPLGPALKKRFRLPTLVESDRNAFVMGEAWRGAARGCRDVVFLAVGTGIGAGILTGGRLLRGHGELAGSVGWMALRNRYQPIYRSIGCFETHASGTGIGLAASKAFGRKLSARELTVLARRGNRKAKKLLESAGHDLGLGLSNLVDVLNPEVIVIGGGVAAAGNLVLNVARKTMKQWGQPLAVKQVRVVRSRLGTRAGLLGAARLAFDHCDRLATRKKKS